jgi:hypothetical protein
MYMNNSKYLIGAFNDGKLAQRYFDSLSVLGDTVEPIIIQYLRRGKFDRVTVPPNVKLIKYQKHYPGNTGKHKDFREILAPLLTRDKWCIFTDMHDVAFQAPLPEFPDSELLVAPEAVKFGDVDYWRDIFPQEVWNLDVYNVGCFASRRDVLLKFWEYLYENWMEFYGWYKQGTIMRIGTGDKFPFNIPFHEKVRVDMAVMFNGHYDTLAFNKFLRNYRTEVVSNLFGCYAYQVEKRIIEDRNGQLYHEGKLVSISHFNGSMKKYMKRRKEAKYE